MKVQEAHKQYVKAGQALEKALEKEWPRGTTVYAQLKHGQYNLSKMKVIHHHTDGYVVCEMYTPDKWNGDMKRYVRNVFFKDIKA